MVSSIEEINSTTVVLLNDGGGVSAAGGDDGINGLLDSSQDEYFRLYEVDEDGDVDALGDSGISNFIVGIWNPNQLPGGSNQTASTTNMNSYSNSNSDNNNNNINISNNNGNIISLNSTFRNANESEDSISTWTSISRVETSSASQFDTNSPEDFYADTVGTSTGIDEVEPPRLFRTVFRTVASAAGDSTAPISTVRSKSTGNYGSEDVDIALIDSAETMLDTENDYGETVGFNVATGNVDSDENGLVHQSIAATYNGELLKNYSIHHNFDGGGGIEANNRANSGSIFMLSLDDFGEYFYNYNGSMVSGTTTTIPNDFNNTILDYGTNCTNLSSTSISCYDLSEIDHNYWALILILFPILTLFGNILVILSVFRERSLQTVTNYFIVSLAIADLLVAVVVMPFGVYALFYGIWALPDVVCDFYIAMDVICSTSSIFNLVAISIDRYIAVTQPIKYAKHKNSRRVCLTILLVWAISAAIGSPIVLGLNNTPNRDPDLCIFYNTDFILYSSLSSFYIPCIIMVFLYWNIFKALRSRARKQRAARKPHMSELTGGSVIENIVQTRRLAETALDNSHHATRFIPDEQATNTGSGSNEEEDENAISPDIDDCHVIVNDKSTEFMLATVVEETGNVVAQITSQPQLVVADPNGNHDSGYAPSNVDDVLAGAAAIDSSPPDSPILPSGTTLARSSISSSGRQVKSEGSPKRDPALSVAMKPLSFVRYGVQEAMTLARNDSTLSATSKVSRKDKKNSQASRFTIYKVHKASKKKREKSSAKKERKATKTLAIVLGVFLFCWLPFFTCNIMDAMCAKFEEDCRPGVTAFILTTWLGYINSFVNPVIYTIFNPEFRKAFKKIMHLG